MTRDDSTRRDLVRTRAFTRLRPGVAIGHLGASAARRAAANVLDMLSISPRTIAASAVALILAGGTAGALAAGTTTTVAVDSLATLKAGDTSPADVPGVKALRAGKPIPAGYQLIGRKVQITRGTSNAGAALRFTCPGTTRLRSFAVSGRAGFQAPTAYVGKKATWIISTPAGGASSSGSVYAACR